MDLLDVLLATGDQVREEEEAKKREKEEKKRLSIGEKNGNKKDDNDGWELKGSKSLKSSPASTRILRETRYKSTALSDLVWAPNSSIRGGKLGKDLPGRIATAHEAATCKHLSFPIPPEHVLIEFFGLLENDYFWRIMEIPKDKVRPFDSAPRNNKGKLQTTIYDSMSLTKENQKIPRWDVDSLLDMKAALKEKYGPAEGERIHRHTQNIADDFLKKALELQNQDDLKAIAEGTTDGGDEDYTKDTVDELEESVELEDMAKMNDGPQEEVELKAGMWITYEEKQLRNSIRAQIIQVTTDEKVPLVLDTEGIVFLDHIIRVELEEEEVTYEKDDKHKKDESAKNIKKICARKLKDFKLVVSMIEKDSATTLVKRAAKRGNAQFTRETGVALNERRKSLKPSSTSAPNSTLSSSTASHNENNESNSNT